MQLLLVLISGAVLLGLVAWGQRPEHVVPTWLYLLVAAPLAWVRLFGGDDDDAPSGPRKGLGIAYLFVASAFLVVVGSVGLALRGAWGEFLWPALPLGGVVFVLALLAVWFNARR